MTIGEYVKQYRKSQGLSMQAFGEKCNLSRAYISGTRGREFESRRPDHIKSLGNRLKWRFFLF